MPLLTGNQTTYTCDVLVIGSGVSGYCAAIQAGRCGRAVILVEKDEVLGGNSGPNLGVGITGADRYNAYAAETGIVHELQEEAAWVGAFTALGPGAMPYNISRRYEAVVQEALRRAGVRVLKRHYARAPLVEADASGRPRIVAVIAEDLAAYRTVQVGAGIVVDASGDGQIAALAGAEYDVGSEAQSEYGERSAPPQRTRHVQGTSLVALAHRVDRRLPFVPPGGTPPYEPRVWHGTIGSFVQHTHDGWFRAPDLVYLYVTETGGHLDTIADDAEIYERLLEQLWAEWDHVKNGPHAEEAANWDLLWVSPKAGKRESRRFLCQAMLTQADLEQGRCFPDDIAYGGHDLDDHQPLGESADIFAHSIPPLYGIPYRCLVPAGTSIDNLLLGGRLIGATHLAHSSTRVMRTGGAIGQALGMAADLCLERGMTPASLARDAEGVRELQQRLLRADATILGLAQERARDLARAARVSAGSELRFNEQRPAQLVPLIADAGNQLWDWPERLEQVALYLANRTDVEQHLRLSVYRTHREPRWKTREAYVEHGWNDLRQTAFRRLGTVEAGVPPGFQGWQTIAFPKALQIGAKDPASDDDRVLVGLDRNPDLFWALAGEHVARYEIAAMVERPRSCTRWQQLDVLGTMRLTPAPALGEASNAVDGHHRRYSCGPTHMWISNPADELPQSLVLSWPEPRRFDKVALTFDNLCAARHENPWESGTRVVPWCVSCYSLEAWVEGGWREIIREEENYHRFREHRFAPLTADRLRLTVHATHGEGHSARVYRVSVYDGDASYKDSA